MDEATEHVKIPVEQNTSKDDGAQYVECVRLAEGGHIRRLENIVAKFDVVQYESNDGDDGPTKPLIFYAIEHNDETLVKFLFEIEVVLNKSYSVSELISIYFDRDN